MDIPQKEICRIRGHVEQERQPMSNQLPYKVCKWCGTKYVERLQLVQEEMHGTEQ